jgi:hypothetical protein
MVRFLVVEPTHPGSNPRFGMGVSYLQLIILSVVCDVPVDSNALLVTNFMHLKIKLAQSFEGAHSGRMCVCIFIGECLYVYEYLHLYCVSKKTTRLSG